MVTRRPLLALEFDAILRGVSRFQTSSAPPPPPFGGYSDQRSGLCAEIGFFVTCRANVCPFPYRGRPWAARWCVNASNFAHLHPRLRGQWGEFTAPRPSFTRSETDFHFRPKSELTPEEMEKREKMETPKERLKNMVKRHAQELKAGNKIGGRSQIMSIEGRSVCPCVCRGCLRAGACATPLWRSAVRLGEITKGGKCGQMGGMDAGVASWDRCSEGLRDQKNGVQLLSGP